MQLIKHGGSAAFNPALISTIQYHTGKGVRVMGNNGKPLAYVEETDSAKGLEILQALTKAIIKDDECHRMIELKDYAVINIALIASVTTDKEILVINDSDSDAIYWLTTASEEEAKKVAEEVIKAINEAGKGKRYTINWAEIMPAS